MTDNKREYYETVRGIAAEVAHSVFERIIDKVVCCKNCRYYKLGFCVRNRLYRNSYITLEPESYFLKVKPDDFCSWGERKDNEEEEANKH